MQAPQEPLNQSERLWLWALAYLILASLFIIVGWVLFFEKDNLISTLAFTGSLISCFMSRKRASLAKTYEMDKRER